MDWHVLSLQWKKDDARQFRSDNPRAVRMGSTATDCETAAKSALKPAHKNSYNFID